MVNGKKCQLENLVPGDVVRLRLGDIIPADVKLIEGDFLLTDESALTGESLPVEKHLSDLGYASIAIVKQGEMNALVINTASRTFFGKTAKLVQIAKTPSHFQKAISKIGDYLIFLAIGLENNRTRLDFSRSKHLRNYSVCIDLNCCRDTCSAFCGPFSHNGCSSHSPREERSDSQQISGH